MPEKAKKEKLSKTVEIIDGVIIRKVDSINDSKKIMDVINSKGLFGKSVVRTKIYSETENLLEHEFLHYLIHSGEYTESMAVDVTQTAMDMCMDFYENDGIFSWDLMPHNYTYKDGEWLLYDFGAFDLNPNNVKTQIRSLFKISFSAFELSKVIERKYLKHYYLNRIKSFDLLKMISFKDWLSFSFNLRFCQCLFYIRNYKAVYKFLNDVFNSYKKNYKKEFYDYSISDEEQKISCFINNLINSCNVNSIFYAGEKSIKYALQKEVSNIDKFLYIDDYEICDKFYNLIYSQKLNKISTAVLYPYVCDAEIPSEYKYRALYDDFAKERFVSDAAVIVDINESYSENIDEYIKNISDFAAELLILKLDDSSNLESIKACLAHIFNDINIFEVEKSFIIEAKDKKITTDKDNQKKEYKNNNRGPEAELHTKRILELLRMHK